MLSGLPPECTEASALADWIGSLGRDGELHDVVALSLSLDVRAANVPAIKLYTKLGFRFGDNAFPGFLDWDGGFSGEASAAAIAEACPPNCDLSGL